LRVFGIKDGDEVCALSCFVVCSMCMLVQVISALFQVISKDTSYPGMQLWHANVQLIGHVLLVHIKIYL
jgi:hypothetical protein